MLNAFEFQTTLSDWLDVQEASHGRANNDNQDLKDASKFILDISDFTSVRRTLAAFFSRLSQIDLYTQQNYQEQQDILQRRNSQLRTELETIAAESYQYNMLLMQLLNTQNQTLSSRISYLTNQEVSVNPEFQSIIRGAQTIAAESYNYNMHLMQALNTQNQTVSNRFPTLINQGVSVIPEFRSVIHSRQTRLSDVNVGMRTVEEQSLLAANYAFSSKHEGTSAITSNISLINQSSPTDKGHQEAPKKVVIPPCYSTYRAKPYIEKLETKDPNKTQTAKETNLNQNLIKDTDTVTTLSAGESKIVDNKESPQDNEDDSWYTPNPKEDRLRRIQNEVAAANTNKNCLMYYNVDPDEPEPIPVYVPNQPSLYMHHITLEQGKYSTKNRPHVTHEISQKGLINTKRNTRLYYNTFSQRVQEAIKSLKTEDTARKGYLPAIVCGRLNELETSEITIIPNDIVITHTRSQTSRIHAAIYGFDTLISRLQINTEHSAFDKEKDMTIEQQRLIEQQMITEQQRLILVDMTGNQNGCLIKPKSSIFELTSDIELKHILKDVRLEIQIKSNDEITFIMNRVENSADINNFTFTPVESQNEWDLVIDPKTGQLAPCNFIGDVVAKLSYRKESRKWFLTNHVENKDPFDGFWVKTRNFGDSDIQNPYFFMEHDYLLMMHHLFWISRDKNECDFEI
jgi:hypothetical protein